MGQELAEPKQNREMRTNTQVFKIQKIWKNLQKTEFNKETDHNRKTYLKGQLYTKVSEIYEAQEGRSIQRHVVRRCVNSLMIKAK